MKNEKGDGSEETGKLREKCSNLFASTFADDDNWRITCVLQIISTSEPLYQRISAKTLSTNVIIASMNFMRTKYEMRIMEIAFSLPSFFSLASGWRSYRFHADYSR